MFKNNNGNNEIYATNSTKKCLLFCVKNLDCGINKPTLKLTFSNSKSSKFAKKTHFSAGAAWQTAKITNSRANTASFIISNFNSQSNFHRFIPKFLTFPTRKIICFANSFQNCIFTQFPKNYNSGPTLIRPNSIKGNDQQQVVMSYFWV